MNRRLLVALALTGACTSPQSSTASPAPSATTTTPTQTIEPASLPAWPTPRLSRVGRGLEDDLITVTLEGASLDATVTVRGAFGPVPPTCDTGSQVDVTHAEDGTYRFELDRLESATVCVRDAEGNVRATVTTLGHRSVPWHHEVRSRGQVSVWQSIQRLDDDATALVYVRVPADAELPRTCRTEAGTGPHDDPPERCAYDCSSGVVLDEIPRDVVDRLVASAANDTTESEELLAAMPLAVRLPLEVGPTDEVLACVRSTDGSLTSDSGPREVEDGAWYGCDFDTVGSCIADPLRQAPLAVGDTLLGRTEDGTIVRATIRRAVLRDTQMQWLELPAGMQTRLPSDAVVLTTRGDVRVDQLVAGDALVRDGGAVPITSIGRPSADSATRVDLAGAAYWLHDGFAVRDLGGVETESAPAHQAPLFGVESGNSDCSIAVSWIAASTPHDVSVSVRGIESGPMLAPGAADCSEPLVTIEAATLAAVASLGPRAQVELTLFDDDHRVHCGARHRVSRCEGTRALGEALAVEAAATCLPAGTLIDVPGGQLAIEKLEPGDEVISFDAREGLTSAQVIGMTTHADRALLRITLDDGTTLDATPEHVMMAGEHPTARTASELRRGDILTMHVGDAVMAHRIASIAQAGRADVYELRITQPDTYFANGILVHNY